MSMDLTRMMRTTRSQRVPGTCGAGTVLSLELGEYVGFEPYLRLRDRMHELQLPEHTHNLLIETLIDTHDVNYMNHGVACVTLITRDLDGFIDDIHIMNPDEPGGAPLV